MSNPADRTVENILFIVSTSFLNMDTGQTLGYPLATFALDGLASTRRARVNATPRSFRMFADLAKKIRHLLLARRTSSTLRS
jgi:hypothetical protein